MSESKISRGTVLQEDKIVQSTMKRYEVLVFITGAITLSLEVLASRMMTPYFGVSLYIWSGILSITLVFLAIGYRLGGIVSAKVNRQTMEYIFLAMPIASALAIALSTLAYPLVFPLLSQTNLIVGSFVAATLLLAFPLIALSAMNPLLISLQQQQSKLSDSGAGQVFFISTMGSVAGVIFTAFLLIPNVTNFRAILILGVSVSVAVILLTLFARNILPKQKKVLLVSGLAIIILCGTIFAGKASYLNFVSSAFSNPLSFKIKAEYTSMFGNIKVAVVDQKDGSGSPEKYFIQDGLMQNRTTLENTSVSMYTYVLETLVHTFVPEAKDVLVLGLGAGIVPRHFKQDGKNVSVVEINTAALKAATNNFGFDKSGIQIFLEDARTFVRNCETGYDAAVVDLFLGDGVPDYLMTKEFFADLKNCIKPGGAIVMNTFFDENDEVPNLRLLATVASSFPKLYISGISGGNIFVVGLTGPAPKEVKVKIEATGLSNQLTELINLSVSNIQFIPTAIFQNIEPISDDHNIFGLLFVNANMADRQSVAEYLPPHILVN